MKATPSQSRECRRCTRANGGLEPAGPLDVATTTRRSTAAAVCGRSPSPVPIPQHHRARRVRRPTGVWFAPSRTVPRPPARGDRRDGGAPSPRQHRRSPELRLLSRTPTPPGAPWPRTLRYSKRAPWPLGALGRFGRWPERCQPRPATSGRDSADRPKPRPAPRRCMWLPGRRHLGRGTAVLGLLEACPGLVALAGLPVGFLPYEVKTV